MTPSWVLVYQRCADLQVAALSGSKREASGPRTPSPVCFLESLQTNLKVKDSSLISGD